MLKRSVLLIFISVGLGILIILLQSFLWKFSKDFNGFLIGSITTLVSLIVMGGLLLISICFVFSNWKEERFLAFLPFLVVMLTIGFAFILPTKIITWQQNNFFEKNFLNYSEVVEQLKGESFKQGFNSIKLPGKYVFLSDNGEIGVYLKGAQLNVTFSLRSCVGSGEMLEYTSNGKTMFEGKKSFKAFKKKSNWYYVIEEG
jgi:hypothetical protein